MCAVATCCRSGDTLMMSGTRQRFDRSSIRSHTRRRVCAGALVSTVWLPWRTLARTATESQSTEAMIDEFVRGTEIVADDRLTLELPPVAENGHSVACAVHVESPMSVDDHVEAVLVLAPANPNRRVATFRFTPASGVAAVATRIRLAETQTVLAFARTSRAETYRARRTVEVVVGGCAPQSE